MKAFRTFLSQLMAVGFLLLTIGQHVFAQGSVDRYSRAFARVLQETQVDSLTKFSQLEQRLSLERKALAEATANRNGWPLRQVNSDGSVIEIIDIDSDGKPVYVATSNLTAARSISTHLVWPTGPLGLNLSSAGLTAGEWDAGRVRLSHVEFQGRAVQGDGNPTNDAHATHVAGTIIAGGVDPTAIGGSFQGNLRAFDWNSDAAEMAAEAATGLLISNHSYGTITGWYRSGGTTYWYGSPSVDPMTDWKFGFYDNSARNWDNIARNAPYYLIMKAAGNDRSDNHTGTHKVWNGGWVDSSDPRNPDGQYDCISTYGTAKNIMTVGAVNDIPGGWTQTSDVVMSGFSGWGPTDDGRIKPDIVANGVGLRSCGPSNDTHYQSMSGTSMATPSATGSALLLQQHYHDRYGIFMRSATLKGLIIHTADEAGRPGPDYSFGWGLMNTAKAAQHISDNRVRTHVLEENLDQSQTFTMQVYSDGTAPLVATICWTDPAGTPHAAALNNRTPKLINDLDLRISSGASTWQPFVLNPSSPAANATTGDNIVDNVEQVRIATPAPGYYTITITHKGTLAGGAQPFSLLISRVSCYAAITPSYDQHICASSPLNLQANDAPSSAYQWFLNGNPIPGETNATFAAAVSGLYKVEVNNGFCAAQSLEREITVDPVTVGGTLASTALTVCYGNHSETLSLSGQVGQVVRWEFSEDNWTTVRTIDNTNSSLVFSNLISDRSYRAVVQSGACSEEFSSQIDVEVVGNGGTVNSSAAVCFGDNSGTLTLAGHTANVIGWEYSTDNWLTSTVIPNVTDLQSYSNLTQETRFRARLIEAPCPLLLSTDVRIEIIPLLDVQASATPAGPICITDGGVQLDATYNENAPYDRCTEYSLSSVAYLPDPHAGSNVFSTAVDDAVSNAIPIGFDFKFFCNVYSQVYVSSNGFLSFTPTSADGCCSGEPLPQVDAHSNIISGCWTDNRLMNANDVKYQVLGTAPNRRFVVSFGGTYQYYASSPVSFQIALHEASSEVEIVHINVPANSGFTRTAGIENADHTIGMTPAGMNASNSWSSVGQTYRFQPSNSPSLISWTWTNPANGFTANAQSANDPSPPLGSSTYQLVATHGYTGCATRVDVPFQVDPETVGGSLGADRTVCSGAHSDLLTLGGQTGNVVRWETSTDNWTTFGIIPQTLPQLTVTNLTQPTQFRAVVQSGACPEVLSAPVGFIIDSQPIGGSVSAPQTVCAGANSGSLNLAGQSGTILGWERSTDNWTTVTPVANLTDLQAFSGLTQTTRFRAVIGNGVCPAVNSLDVEVSVDQPSQGGTLGSPATLCAGVNSHTLLLGGQTGGVIRWESSQDGWNTITSISNANVNLTVSDLTQSTAFRAVVQNGVCAEAMSNPVRVQVDQLTQAGILSQDMTLCRGMNQGLLVLNGNNGSILSWERSLNNWATFASFPTSSSTRTLLNETLPYAWRVRVKNGVCPASTSTPAQISIDERTQPGTLTASSLQVCESPNTVSLQVSSHVGQIVSWQRVSLSPFQFQSLPGGVNPLTVNNLTSTGMFSAVVKSGVCPSSTTNWVTVEVRKAPFGGSVTGAATHCHGSANGLLHLSGHSGQIIRWERSTDNWATSSPIPFSGADLPYNQLNQTSRYRAVIGNSPCSPTYSTDVEVVVLPAGFAGVLNASQTVCVDENSGSLNLSAYSGQIVRWETSNDNWATWNPVSNNTSTLNFSDLSQSTAYRAVVQMNGCPELLSNAVSVIVATKPVAGQLFNDKQACVTASGVLQVVNYQGTLEWESSEDNFQTALNLNHTQPIMVYGPITSTKQYRVKASSPFCPSVYSNAVSIEIFSMTSAGSINGDLLVCADQPNGVLQVNGHTGSVVQWAYSTDAWQTMTVIPLADEVYLFNGLTQDTEFKAWVQNGPCPAVESAPVKIVVSTPPVAGQLSATIESNEQGCLLPYGTLNLEGSEGSISHWEYSKDGGATWTTVNHTGETYQYSSVHHAALFRVAVVTPACSPAYSNQVAVSAGLGLTAQVSNGCGAARIDAKVHGGAEPYGYFLVPAKGVQGPTGVFTNVPQGTYYLYVRDGRYCYAYTTVVVTGTPESPAIKEVSLNAQGNMLVKWNPLPPQTGVYYQLRYRRMPDVNWSMTALFTSTQRALAGTAGQSYEIQLRAYCSQLTPALPWSTSAFFTVPDSREASVTQDFASSKLVLYPNPSDGRFSLRWHDIPEGPIALDLFDMNGRLIWSRRTEALATEELFIDASGLATGIYSLRVSNASGTHFLKVIVE